MAAPAGTATAGEARAWRLLAAVADPEIPVISVVDLGIVRSVRTVPARGLEVGLSPTYSGCPATAVIRASVVAALEAGGFSPVSVVDVLSPPWSSDWISAEGRRKLENYGIAPPAEAVGSPRALWRPAPPIACPRCGSRSTTETSAFGSTPCKALHRCEACLEPFEYFKCI
jgi:ring-1,2-phenylacetyl-CoA epoxidase subunit PaaD